MGLITNDEFDALVMCELYRRHYLEIYDRRFWVKELNPNVQEIRRTLLDLKTTTSKQTSFINTVNGRLAWEYPARATVQSQRRKGFLQIGQPPVFWAWLAGCGDFLGRSLQSRFNNPYHKKCELGRVQITELTPQFAAVICDLHDVESGLEVRLIELVGDSLFVSSTTKCSICSPSVIGSGDGYYRESTPLKTSSACPKKLLCVAFGKLVASAKSKSLVAKSDLVAVVATGQGARILVALYGLM